MRAQVGRRLVVVAAASLAVLPPDTPPAVADEPITVLLLTAEADAEQLRVKVGIFFAGVLAGCSCADDPTPVEAQEEYGEWLLTIRRPNAEAVAAQL